MWVIVTGVDGAGKTTLCSILKDRLQMSTRKRTVADSRNPIDTVFKDLDSNIDNILWDRWNYPEDIIYNAVVENKGSDLIYRLSDIEAKLNKKGVLFVIVYAKVETLLERVNNRGDHYVTGKHLPALAREYVRFYNSTTVPTILVDSTYGFSEFDLFNIESFVRRNRECM